MVPTVTRCTLISNGGFRKSNTIIITHFIHAIEAKISQISYILESNPHPNLIRTSFCRFLKGKKVSSRF